MWIPKWYWEKKIAEINDLNRRVKRLELIVLNDAENKIASLLNERAGMMDDEVLTIEEIINKRRNIR